MAWKVELDPAAERELDRLNHQIAQPILAFLHDRLAMLDDPRSMGEALKPDGSFSLAKLDGLEPEIISGF